MLDFASALYLGMRHPSDSLGRWDALTLGEPAASADPPGAAALAGQLARLAGSAAATLLPSTLHLFWDLMAMLGREPVALLVDEACYPIARWAAEHAAARGAPLQTFAHGAAGMVARLAERWAGAGRRPLIVADGYFPGADHAPPLRAYADIARSRNGYLVLDDTQAFGLLGEHGGGSARCRGIGGAHVVIGASLAKAFGAPLAVLCASAAMVRRFEAHSETRSHASPPSVAAIRAGLAAMRCNAERGDVLRQHLGRLLAHWRQAMTRLAIRVRGGWFPVQTLALDRQTDGARLYQCLLDAGVRTVPQCVRTRATLSFLLT
ncbi:MAG: 8-amino-7-oxononanoate synthase, partial [Massilia sp.]